MTRDHESKIYVGDDEIEVIAEYDFIAGDDISCATDPGSSDMVEISQVYEKSSKKIIELDENEIEELEETIIKSIKQEGF